jgi:hypothetical protein
MEISDLLSFIAGFLGGIVGVFDVGVRAGAVRVLYEDVKVILPVHQDLVLDHSALLQVL